MGDWLLLLLALLWSVLGFAWIALGMDVHWTQAFGARSRSRHAQTVLRVVGLSALTASFVCALAADHISIAALVWIMTLAAGALIVALTLAFQPNLMSLVVPWLRPCRSERIANER